MVPARGPRVGTAIPRSSLRPTSRASRPPPAIRGLLRHCQDRTEEEPVARHRQDANAICGALHASGGEWGVKNSCLRSALYGQPPNRLHKSDRLPALQREEVSTTGGTRAFQLRDDLRKHVILQKGRKYSLAYGNARCR